MGGSSETFRSFFQRSVALSCVLVFLGLCLQMVALFSPAWCTIGGDERNPSWRIQEGIWMAKFCRMKTGECILGERGAVLKEIGLEESLSRKL